MFSGDPSAATCQVNGCGAQISRGSTTSTAGSLGNGGMLTHLRTKYPDELREGLKTADLVTIAKKGGRSQTTVFFFLRKKCKILKGIS